MKNTLTVIVPAHNEEAQIADTIESLLAQTTPPDRIVVVSDNSTDNTVAIASTFPVVVMETVGNKHRKAGAMVQAWEQHCQDAEFVFTMDADTVLAPDFFARALKLMEEKPHVGGACSCPMLKAMPETGLVGDLLWRLSKLDFGGYMRNLVRWRFIPEVLSGYGTIFRSSALAEIAADSPVGAPWDTNSIVEDYKISLDLRSRGWGLAIIPGALAYTDAPLTMKELWVQRVRWSGGTWQELARAGWKPYTRKVWLGSIMCLVSTTLRVLAVIAWVLVLLLGLPIAWSWIWLIPLGVAVVDRLDMIRYTRNADWKDTLLVGTLLPLELMSMLREAWTLKSAWLVARRRALSW